MDSTHSLALPAEPPSVQKKETNRNFLLFRSLPKEVRLLIWEAAVRPQPSTNYNATHVFRINASGGDDLSSPEASDVGRQSPPLLGSRNTREPDDHKMCEPVSRFPEELKSVTHWDYGLWNACDESRWVISRRFRHKYWEEMKKSVLKDLQTIPQEIVPYTMEFAWLTTNRLMENGCTEDGKWYKDFASVFSIDATHNNIIATHPARDLFLVEDERWMDQMARQPTDRELEDNAVHFLRDNVISPTGDGFPILGHIGFMFDDSWTDHLSRTANPRMSLAEAKTKNNPRGLFLLLLHLMVVRVIGGLRLWLIDEKFEPCHTCKTKSDAEAEAEVEEEKRNRKVFYRYGKEDLVEVDVKPNVMRVITDNTSCIIGTSCGILEFVSLDPIARYPASNPDPRATHIDIWSCVGVLAPRSRTPY